MKHLISLSFKYIRRQKLRSVLTFLCIMLAVFIFNTYTAYLGSTIATLINFEKYYNSSHHVNLSGLMFYCDDKEETAQIIANHAAVEEHYFSNIECIPCSTSRDENGMITYFDIAFDNGRTARINQIYNREVTGNPSLAASQEEIDRNPQYYRRDNDFPENAGIFPYWVKELGYREGDEITMTITPVQGGLSEDSPQVKEIREWIKNNSTGQNYYAINDDPEPGTPPENSGHFFGASLLHYLFLNYTLDEIEFSNEYYGNPYTFTMTIAGFEEKNTINRTLFDDLTTVGGNVGLDITTSPKNHFYIEKIVGETNSEFCERTGMILNNWAESYARISENIDFDDGVMMLLKDLGLEEKHKYDLVFNDTLLAYEMRSANAIASIMPTIAAVLILALVSWLICRFVIDNAFEISVQERSAQFATLRIMGASRAQLVALIFTEALFYCLTAVPIGVIAAFMACKTVMELIGGTLFPIFAFNVNPWITVLGIIISLSGILISAYTSVMWAARKLSPMEALQYGKPRKKAKKEKHRKSVLKRKSFGFVLDYTIKNISRNKNRYVISTIAMTLGIVMFSFSVLGINLVKTVQRENNEKGKSFDYVIKFPSYKTKFAERANELFKDSRYFAKCNMDMDAAFDSYYYDEEMEILQQMMPDGKTTFAWGKHMIKLVSEEDYNAYFADATNMTFEEFKALNGAMIYASSGGSPDECEWNEYGQMIRKQEDGYWSYQNRGFSEPPTVTVQGSSFKLPVVGSVCIDYNLGYVGESTLIIADANLIPENMQGSMSFRIGLTVNGHHNYENAKAAIETLTSEIKGCKVNDAYMENTGLISFFNTIFRTLSIFLVSVWLVGILTMVNSINTSVLNRQKELLMLRSVGMTKRQLQLGVMLEGILYCLVSTIMGLLIGVFGYYVFINYIEWQGTGLTAMQAIILPVTLTVIGTLVLNLLIAIISAVPALDSLSKRMK